MRLVFAGTPAFAAIALEALVAAGHDIALVLTQPDRPAGRGMKLLPSEVKQIAQQHGLTVYQPSTLRNEEAVQRLSTCNAEAMIVAAYGLILPKDVLQLFPLGCINIHASLLPRWRGAAPIQHALLAGDCQTGICIMQMDEGLDTGPVFLSKSVAIGPEETAASLHDKLARLGARNIVDVLSRIESGGAKAKPQPEAGATYAHKIRKEQARIDWSRPAEAIDRQVRAFNPFPVASTSIGDQTIRIWRTGIESTSGPAEAGRFVGEILTVARDGIVVQCGEGILRLLELQRAGGKRLATEDFLRGFPLRTGQRFSL